jgi:hypothetical protein
MINREGLAATMMEQRDGMGRSARAASRIFFNHIQWTDILSEAKGISSS